MQIDIYVRQLGKHRFLCADVGPWHLSVCKDERYLYTRATKSLPHNWGSATLAGCGETASAAIARISESLDPLAVDLAADLAGAFDALFAELDMPAAPSAETVVDRFDGWKLGLPSIDEHGLYREQGPTDI